MSRVAELEPIRQQGHLPGHHQPLEADGLAVPTHTSLDTGTFLC